MLFSHVLPQVHSWLVVLASVLPISVTPLDFGTLIESTFSYANELLPTLGPIAGIGIGFSLAIGAVAWIGAMLSKVFSGRR
jgi:hypothetical protein